MRELGARQKAAVALPGTVERDVLSPVHGRHIDRLCRIQSVTGDIGNTCVTTPPLPQRGCAGLPSQRQRRALGRRLGSSPDGMVRA
jgi:hypothetical protein